MKKDEITFEIDREKLYQYLCTKNKKSIINGNILLYWFFTVFILLAYNKLILEYLVADTKATSNIIYLLLNAVIIIIMTLLGYITGQRRFKKLCKTEYKLMSENIYLGIDGNYVHIINGGKLIEDRKIHFKELDNYICYQDENLRKFNSFGLKMDKILNNGVRRAETINIEFLVNCQNARDQLIKLDLERENNQN